MKKEHIRLVARFLAIAVWVGGAWWKFQSDGSDSVQTVLYLAIWALVGVGVLYIDHRRRQAAFNWPTVLAAVQSCEDHTSGNHGIYELHYSYPVEGEYYSASIRVPRKRWADDPCSMLKGASIQIRVNPRDPEESVVEAASIPGMTSTGRHDLIPCEL